ncbi:MAG: hypothetical protein EOP48_24735 [Sphingobacteriales bacterium]|nr:MAG: hypothetical protein EOP48_24735 [Sphingobacteriales bacterium]
MEIQTALGAAGTPSKIEDLKSFSELLFNLSIELFNWETRNEQLIPPEGLSEVKHHLSGMSDLVISQLNTLPNEIRRVIEANKKPNKTHEECSINLTLDTPIQLEKALEVFTRYYRLKGVNV